MKQLYVCVCVLATPALFQLRVFQIVTMETFSLPFPVTSEILRTDKPVEEVDVYTYTPFVTLIRFLSDLGDCLSWFVMSH